MFLLGIILPIHSSSSKEIDGAEGKGMVSPNRCEGERTLHPEVIQIVALAGGFDTYIRTRGEQEENQMKKYKWEQEQISHMKVCLHLHQLENSNTQGVLVTITVYSECWNGNLDPANLKRPAQTPTSTNATNKEQEMGFNCDLHPLVYIKIQNHLAT